MNYLSALLTSSDCARRWPHLVACGLASRDLRGLVVVGADLYAGQMQGCDFSGARLPSVIARHTTLDRARFDGAHLSRAHMDLVSARRTSWRGANLSGAYLERVDFSRSDLRGCSFFGAWIVRCDFSRAQLTGADFRRAHVERCTWRRTRTRRYAFGLPPNRALMRLPKGS